MAHLLLPDMPLDAVDCIALHFCLKDLVALSEVCRALNVLARGCFSCHARVRKWLDTGKLWLLDVPYSVIPRVAYKMCADAWPHVTFRYERNTGRGQLKIKPPTWVTRASNDLLPGHEHCCTCDQCAAVRVPNRIVFAWDGARPPPDTTHTMVVSAGNCSVPIPQNVKALQIHFTPGGLPAGVIKATELRVLKVCQNQFSEWPAPHLLRLAKVVIDRCHHLSNISAFSNVTTAIITNCDAVHDVQHLRRCAKVNISGCTNVQCVASLRDVADLNVSNCLQLSKFCDLANVVRLNASRTGIASTVGLVNVQRLGVVSCSKLLSLEGLPSATVVNASGAYKLTDLSKLAAANLFSIDLSGSCVNCIAAVCHAREIRIDNCPNLVDLRGMLTGSPVTNLSASASSVQELPVLPDLESVVLDHCTIIHPDRLAHVAAISLRSSRWPYMTGNPFKNATVVDLSHTTLDSVEGLQSVPDLTLSGCRYITTMLPLAGSRGRIVARDCWSLLSAEGLESKQVVILDRCHKLLDVACLAAVPFVSLAGCKCVQVVHSLAKVQHLDISRCPAINPESVKLLASVPYLKASKHFLQLANRPVFECVSIALHDTHIVYTIKNVGRALGHFTGSVVVDNSTYAISVLVLRGEMRDVNIAHASATSVTVFANNGEVLRYHCKKRKRV